MEHHEVFLINSTTDMNQFKKILLLNNTLILASDIFQYKIKEVYIRSSRTKKTGRKNTGLTFFDAYITPEFDASYDIFNTKLLINAMTQGDKKLTFADMIRYNKIYKNAIIKMKSKYRNSEI